MIKKDVRKAYVFSKAGKGGARISEGDQFMGSGQIHQLSWCKT